MNRRRAPLSGAVVPVCMSLVLAACGDDDTVKPVAEELQIEFVTQTLDDIRGALETSDVESMLGQVAFVFSQGEPAGLPAAARAVGLSAPAEAMPWLGKTLVYDLDALRWVVDPELSGAPATGVRFVVYDMDPGTNAPVRPLVVTGWLDVWVVSEDETSVALAVELVSTTGATPVVLLDYEMELAVTDDATGSGVFLDAAGGLGQGAARLAFDVSASFDFPATGTVGTYTSSVEFDHGAKGTFRQSAEETFDLGSFQVVGEAPWVTTVSRAGETLLVDLLLNGDDETVSGTVKHDGVTRLTVSGLLEAPVYRLPDGRTPSAATLETVTRAWDSILETNSFGLLFLSPLYALASL